MNLIGLYIHIPFCKQKCKYCDFISFENCEEDIINDYIKALIEEIKFRANSLKTIDNKFLVKTIYIGGGTPSIINEKHIYNILDTIYDNFEIMNNCEISIEVNPGTINETKLKTYKEIGINRLSVGLQTANNRLLKLIGRIHNYEDYYNTIKCAKKIGFTNINTDLIIGLPTQNIYDIEKTLDCVLDLDLTHISVYSLILEENTELYKMVKSGKYRLPDEEIERYMYWYAKRRLEDNGFIHYEISNFAKPSYRCQHNIDCWNQKEYLGMGINAASYMSNLRFKNISNLKQYISNIKNNKWQANIIIEEKQTKRDQMNEYIILGLRMSNGVSLDKFERKFQENLSDIYWNSIIKLIQDNLVVIDDNRYLKLTKKGLDYANIVWEAFL